MMPIQDLLHRILWDRRFGQGEFTLGYYDRIEQKLVLVPLRDIEFPKDSPGVFELIDGDGMVRTIPLHRVREVYKNGELIWRRE